MGLENLANNRPLAFYFQQLEEVGEREAGHAVGIDTSTRGITDDFNTSNRGLRVGRGTEILVNSLEQDWNRAAFQLALGADALHRRMFIESGFHDTALGLLATLNIRVKHLCNSLIVFYIRSFSDCFTTDNLWATWCVFCLSHRAKARNQGHKKQLLNRYKFHLVALHKGVQLSKYAQPHKRSRRSESLLCAGSLAMR